MNKLNIETIKVRSWDWDHKSQTFLSTGIGERVGLDTKNYQDCLKDLRGLTLGQFVEGKKVYFHDSVVFSRSKFREMYPNNKITYKIDNADLIIIDKDVMLAMYDVANNYRQRSPGNVLHPYLYPSKDGADVFCDTCKNGNPHVSSSVYVRSFIYLEHLFSGRGILKVKDVEDINNILSNPSKIIGVDGIDLKSEVMLEEENYTMLQKLLGSGQQEHMQLAVTMLAGFDYNYSKQRIAILLFKHWATWNKFYNKKIHITLRTMLTRLFKEFPNIVADRYGVRNHNSFWYGLFSIYHKDGIVEREFLDWLKGSIDCPADNLEVVVRVKGTGDEILKESSSDIAPKDFKKLHEQMLFQAQRYITNYLPNEEDEKEIEDLGF